MVATKMVIFDPFTLLRTQPVHEKTARKIPAVMQRDGVGILPCIGSVFDPSTRSFNVLARSVKRVASGNGENCSQRRQYNKKLFHKFLQIAFCFSFLTAMF
jgi:hypothetical protein